MTIRSVDLVLVFPFYLSLFIELMILFLLAASCLPDEPPADCDLGAFYEANQRTLWTVFGVFQLSFFLHWIYFGGAQKPGSAWLVVLTPLLLYALLAVVRGRRVHLVIPTALVAWELFANWGRSLTEPLN